MEDNFRNVLIILSAIVITAIFIHGLWTIRKQKNPYKLTASKDKVEPIKRDFDGKGFDQDGVGQVKVKKTTVSNEINDDASNITKQLLASDIELPDDLSKSQLIIKKNVLGNLSSDDVHSDSISSIQAHSTNEKIEDDWFKDDSGQLEQQVKSNKMFDLINSNSSDLETNINVSNTVAPSFPKEKPRQQSQPLYEQPVTQAKPGRSELNKNTQKTTKSLPRNQLEMDFTKQQASDDNAIEAPNIDKNKSEKQITEIEPQVIVLSVVMPANQQMLGAALLPTLLTLGLKYGEMNIFHRHEDNAGQGKVTFSLANIMNPGSFDLDTIETFATRGVSLFMTLPNAGDPFYVFEQMLNAAKQLAQEFNAQVLDEKRNILTKQTEQHYVNNIREFERISRVNSVQQ
jgi:cell division protein ZipA